MINTKRLLLRPWQNRDVQEYAAINADKEVMRYFPSNYSEAESKAQIQRFNQSINELGFGFWAAELLETRRCIGFIGLSSLPKELPFSPCVEIGWRLARNVWRKGLASEGANAVLDYAFETLELNEIVSVTPVTNIPSQGVMKKIGMVRQAGTFLHPRIKPEHELAEHVLFKLDQHKWHKRNLDN